MEFALAHALDHEMLIFRSPDLKNWTLNSAFGKGLGAQDGVWECPDLFELTVEGSGEKVDADMQYQSRRSVRRQRSSIFHW